LPNARNCGDYFFRSDRVRVTSVCLAGYGVLVLLGFEIGRAACLVMLFGTPGIPLDSIKSVNRFQRSAERSQLDIRTLSPWNAIAAVLRCGGLGRQNHIIDRGGRPGRRHR
jgi:hypothetical protein